MPLKDIINRDSENIFLNVSEFAIVAQLIPFDGGQPLDIIGIFNESILQGDENGDLPVEMPEVTFLTTSKYSSLIKSRDYISVNDVVYQVINNPTDDINNIWTVINLRYPVGDETLI